MCRFIVSVTEMQNVVEISGFNFLTWQKEPKYIYLDHAPDHLDHFDHLFSGQLSPPPSSNWLGPDFETSLFWYEIYSRDQIWQISRIYQKKNPNFLDFLSD